MKRKHRWGKKVGRLRRASWHVKLDVTSREASILGDSAVLSCSGEEFLIDKLVVDTGLQVDLLAPQTALERGLQVDDLGPVELDTLGGLQRVQAGATRFRLGRWVLDVQVAFHDRPEWLIGWPVLRHLDIVLRHLSPLGPRLVGRPDEGLLYAELLGGGRLRDPG